MGHSNIDDYIAAMLAKAEALQTQRFSRSHAASCSAKDRYPTEAAAKAVALMNGMAYKLLVYQCDQCTQWHLAQRHKRG